MAISKLSGHQQNLTSKCGDDSNEVNAPKHKNFISCNNSVMCSFDSDGNNNNTSKSRIHGNIIEV